MLPSLSTLFGSDDHEFIPLRLGMMPEQVDKTILCEHKGCICMLRFTSTRVMEGICRVRFVIMYANLYKPNIPCSLSSSPVDEILTIDGAIVFACDRICGHKPADMNSLFSKSQDLHGNTFEELNRAHMEAVKPLLEYIMAWGVSMMDQPVDKACAHKYLTEVNNKIARMLYIEKPGIWRKVPRDVILLIVNMITYD